MLNNYEVRFTVYEDADRQVTNSNLTDLVTTIQAHMPQQAQSMVEAQYGNRVRIWSVVQR